MAKTLTGYSLSVFRRPYTKGRKENDLLKPTLSDFSIIELHLDGHRLLRLITAVVWIVGLPFVDDIHIKILYRLDKEKAAEPGISLATVTPQEVRYARHNDLMIFGSAHTS